MRTKMEYRQAGELRARARGPMLPPESLLAGQAIFGLLEG